MPMRLARAVINADTPLSRPLSAVWITDEVLHDSFARFSALQPACTHSPRRRHGSNVPGPMEARRRLDRRRMNSISIGPEVGFHLPPQQSFLGRLFELFEPLPLPLPASTWLPPRPTPPLHRFEMAVPSPVALEQSVQVVPRYVVEEEEEDVSRAWLMGRVGACATTQELLTLRKSAECADMGDEEWSRSVFTALLQRDASLPLLLAFLRHDVLNATHGRNAADLMVYLAAHGLHDKQARTLVKHVSTEVRDGKVDAGNLLVILRLLPVVLQRSGASLLHAYKLIWRAVVHQHSVVLGMHRNHFYTLFLEHISRLDASPEAKAVVAEVLSTPLRLRYISRHVKDALIRCAVILMRPGGSSKVPAPAAMPSLVDVLNAQKEQVALGWIASVTSWLLVEQNAIKAGLKSPAHAMCCWLATLRECPILRPGQLSSKWPALYARILPTLAPWQLASHFSAFASSHPHRFAKILLHHWVSDQFEAKETNVPVLEKSALHGDVSIYDSSMQTSAADIRYYFHIVNHFRPQLSMRRAAVVGLFATIVRRKKLYPKCFDSILRSISALAAPLPLGEALHVLQRRFPNTVSPAAVGGVIDKVSSTRPLLAARMFARDKRVSVLQCRSLPIRLVRHRRVHARIAVKLLQRHEVGAHTAFERKTRNPSTLPRTKVHLIHQVAVEIARQERLAPAEAIHLLEQLRQYLRKHAAPVYPVFSRAFFWVCVGRPLKQGKDVSRQIYENVMRMRARYEGARKAHACRRLVSENHSKQIV